MGQHFHKFRGPTLDAAYKAMRKKLGRGAVVVRTSQRKDAGIAGLLGRTIAEVTASTPAKPQEPALRKRSAVERKYAANATPAKAPDAPGADKVDYFRKLVAEAQQRISVSEKAEGNTVVAPVIPFKPKEAPDAKAEDMRLELRELRNMIQVLVAETPGGDLPSEYAPHYRHLLAQGLSRTSAADLLGGIFKDSDADLLRDSQVFRERLRLEIQKRVVTTGGIGLTAGQCKIVALIGATGVGKTTNLAKLAAQFAVRERARVALITTDTYRVAAPEHLRVYANIIGVPMKVVHDEKELHDALRTFRDYDLVLMDTAGGSHFNTTQIEELRRLLFAARPDEVSLVLSANTHHEELSDMAKEFECLKPSSLFFSKLDETKRYGAMLNVLAQTKLPLSYLSIGQNVPDDLEVARPGMLSNLILEGGETYGRSSTKSA